MPTLRELADELEELDDRRDEQGPLPRRWLVAGAVWAGVVLAGMLGLFLYSSSPGRAADAPSRWPEATALHHEADRMTLVVVAHPRCSCTRATISELAGLMRRLDGAVAATVVFVRVDGAEEGWEQTDLYRSAARIPGVRVVTDVGGVEAARFGAMTSGQAYLYQPDGALAFHGGITPVRSHVGDSVGRRRIVSLVEGGEAERDRSDVYGCALGDEADDFVLRELRAAGRVGEAL